MSPTEQLNSALSQLGVVLILSLIFYGIGKVLNKTSKKISFLQFVGLQPSNGQFDRPYLGILLGVIFFGVASTYIQFNSTEDFKNLLTGKNSPYASILKSGLDLSSIVAGLIYCFIQASAAEELLFRGLIAKKLFQKLGHFKGNLIQASVFWLLHLLIIKLVSGSWISYLQLVGFITSFGLGLLLGYVNFRKNGQSIFPSWILHGCANFATFLTLAYLL
jgi:uncharacterized protein